MHDVSNSRHYKALFVFRVRFLASLSASSRIVPQNKTRSLQIHAVQMHMYHLYYHTLSVV